MVVFKRQRTGRRPRCWSSSGTHRRVWASPYTLLAALSLSLSLPPSPTRARFDLQTQFTDHTLFCLDSTRPALKAELDRSTKAVLGPSREIGAAPLSHCTAFGWAHPPLGKSDACAGAQEQLRVVVGPNSTRALLPTHQHTGTASQPQHSPKKAGKKRRKGESGVGLSKCSSKKTPGLGFLPIPSIRCRSRSVSASDE